MTFLTFITNAHPIVQLWLTLTMGAFAINLIGSWKTATNAWDAFRALEKVKRFNGRAKELAASEHLGQDVLTLLAQLILLLKNALLVTAGILTAAAGVTPALSANVVIFMVVAAFGSVTSLVLTYKSFRSRRTREALQEVVRAELAAEYGSMTVTTTDAGGVDVVTEGTRVTVQNIEQPPVLDELELEREDLR